MSFAKIRPRRGTANQWSNANPILAEGEIGIEVPSTGVGTGTVKIKFGDGSSHWNDLPYGLDTPNISDVISDEFIAGTPCTSGNYYIANNKLYKCIADTDGSINVTNSNYFEETSVAGEVKTLNGHLTQVQSQIATDTYTKNWNGKIFYFDKYGHIVIMSSPTDLPEGQTLNAGLTTLFTVPEEFKPAQSTYGFCGNNKDMFVDVKKDGVIWVYSSETLTGPTNMACTCVYYVE